MDDHGLPLSVVATSRNDDHGANLRRRMQTFVNAFIAQCQRHDLRAELILVEWNPPADRPRLAETLRWPADPSPCEVRIIEVPAALHRRLPNSQALPLFQMIGKNVGIRRARGRFVLATNIDVLFNDELFRFFRGGEMRPGMMYRIDRTDVDSDVPADAPVEQQLAYCRTHPIRLDCRYGYFRLDESGCIAPEPDDVIAGDGIALKMGFFPVERDRAGRAYRWCGDEAVVVVKPRQEPPRRLEVELEPGPCLKRVPFSLRVEDEQGALVAEGFVGTHGVVSVALPPCHGTARTFRFRPLSERVPLPDDYRPLDLRVYRVGWSPALGDEPGFRFDPLGRSRVWPNVARFLGRLARRCRNRRFVPCRLHRGACGDFTLMAREHWLDLQGYPELPIYSSNLDTLLCWAAICSGVEEVILDAPMRIYHIDHSLGSGVTPEGEGLLFERLSRKGIPFMTVEELYGHVREIVRLGTPRLFNRDDWGMRDEELLETRVGPRRSGRVA